MTRMELFFIPVITCARLSSLMSLNFEAITTFDKGKSLGFLSASSPKTTCHIFPAAGLISFFRSDRWNLFFAIR